MPGFNLTNEYSIELVIKVLNQISPLFDWTFHNFGFYTGCAEKDITITVL